MRDDERRPSPEEMLELARAEEEREGRGKLKVFLGYAPGVGKTFGMLEAAWQQKLLDRDVVAGYVESHGRFETDSMLAGLQIVPKAQIAYKGVTLPEMDLDAVLDRRPQIALVDELAHTNAPGCRHKKRWQDVLELLAAGINVYTTVNIQHLESLNDVVTQITGVVVGEKIPDSVLDRADEIELIDLPPDALRQRLREGKVYVGEMAERAMESYFRTGNLLALREMALRYAAQRVDAQMQSYRREKGVREIWPASERILVCVGANPRSVRLIRAAKQMAVGLHADWMAVHVEAPAKIRPSERDLKLLGEHLHLAESLGAEIVTLSGPRASEEILNFARSRNVGKIIVGKPTHPRWKDKLFGSMLDELVRGSGDIDVYVITGDSAEPPPVRGSAPRQRQRWTRRDWLWSLGTVAACTALAALMDPHVALVDLAMVYLLGVVLVTSRTGQGPSLLATVLGIAAFDFFFIHPYLTFTVSDVRYFVTFFVMFIVFFIVSRLTLRVREQAEAARSREQRIAALYQLSRELVHERGVERLGAIAVKHISNLFAAQAVILAPDGQGGLTVPATSSGTFALDARELSVAHWVLERKQRAGLGTDTLPAAKALYLPLTAASATVGVLGVLPKGGEPFSREQMQALESFANQIAMAIERAFFSEEAQKALLKAETESLRNTLLSSVSHDLRTPLAAITGGASTLLQNRALPEESRSELLQTIAEEAEHLNRIIRNVLDMTRLESGKITLRREWQSLEEVTGVVLNRLSTRLEGRPLQTRLPEDLPLVPFDALLLEQVLTNLLENALKYTPQETPLELTASIREGDLLVELADRGPGLPPGEEERIFEKFFRGHTVSGGVGLGLTICRTIIAAHGGRIWAENRPGGGAVFRFTLPLGAGLPSLPEDFFPPVEGGSQ